MGEIQNSEGRVKTLPPDAVKDGCGEEGVLGARVGVGGWVGGGAGGGHLMGPLSSGQLRPAAEAALVSVRDLATDQSAPPSQLIFSFNCEPVIQLCIGSWLEPPLRHRNHKAPLSVRVATWRIRIKFHSFLFTIIIFYIKGWKAEIYTALMTFTT